MGYTCCVPGCDSGYKSCKSETKIPLFGFPEDEVMKNKWIKAIPRKDWCVTKSHKVCIKHFEEQDIIKTSTDHHERRLADRESIALQRLRLKPNAIPRIFQGKGLPSYLSSTQPQQRTTAATSASRQLKENLTLEKQEKELFLHDAVDNFDVLLTKLDDVNLPKGYICLKKELFVAFHLIDHDDNESVAPRLLVSVIVNKDMTVRAFTSSTCIPQSSYREFLDDGSIKSTSNLSNLLAFCKSLYEYDIRDRSCYVELAVSALKHFESSATSNCIGSENSENTTIAFSLIQFLIEQMRLSLQPKHGRRYSTNLITLAFLWQLTSTALYEKLRQVLILPSVTRLRQYSAGMTVATGRLDLSYLALRTKNLSAQERTVTLMIDEVYTAQRIEYSNGSFVGLTEEGARAKTVLTFMVQSVCSKYKDVVCLLPVNQLDTGLLKSWFQKVMGSLNDLLFVVAVSVDNHVCNRKLFLDLCGGSLKSSIQHPTIPTEQLFLLFDFTHNFKNIFNNFLNKSHFNIPTLGYENILGSSCNPQFRHIKKLYAEEESNPLKVAHKLKKASLNPANIARTSPQHAISVFSESTAAALHFKRKKFPEMLETYGFVKFVSDLWKVMSLKTPSKGQRKKDELCEPLSPGSDSLIFLDTALEIFKKWKDSGSRGLTNETFLACIQSIEAMRDLANYLINNHNFIYILPGKFSSDAIEGRFGWYRQANGGNFFMSLKQLLQVEKKIRCISLLQQQLLDGASRLSLCNIEPIAESDATTERAVYLDEYLCTVNVNELTCLSESDSCVVFFVGGYIGRSIARRRKCDSCKSLLVKSDDMNPMQQCVSKEYSSLLEFLNRGGLAEPTDYCFVVATLAVQVYEKLMADDAIKKIFFSCNNQRLVFVQFASKVAESSPVFKALTTQTCSRMHKNFSLILQTAFNCFAKNALKRFNSRETEAPAKMARAVRKLLTAKSSHNSG